MRALSTVLLASLLLPVAAPLTFAQEGPADEPVGEDAGDEEGDGEGADDEESEREKRKARREEERARKEANQGLLDAVEEVLHAARARVTDDGRVELSYTFKADDEMLDWELEGFDRAEEGNKRGRRRGRGGEKGKNLALGVGSSRQGLLRHKLELSGDFEVRFKLRILRSSSDSDLVVGVGKAGARFGTQLVKRRSSGFKALSRRSEVDKDAFAGGRMVTITLTREGGVFSSRAGSGDRHETDKLSKEAEGEPLLFAADMHLVVDEVVIVTELDSEQIYALDFD
jgi:hypothetical protein